MCSKSKIVKQDPFGIASQPIAICICILLADDIPLLSKQIKKGQKFELVSV